MNRSSFDFVWIDLLRRVCLKLGQWRSIECSIIRLNDTVVALDIVKVLFVLIDELDAGEVVSQARTRRRQQVLSLRYFHIEL